MKNDPGKNLPNAGLPELFFSSEGWVWHRGCGRWAFFGQPFPTLKEAVDREQEAPGPVLCIVCRRKLGRKWKRKMKDPGISRYEAKLREGQAYRVFATKIDERCDCEDCEMQRRLDAAEESPRMKHVSPTIRRGKVILTVRDSRESTDYIKVTLPQVHFTSYQAKEVIKALEITSADAGLRMVRARVAYSLAAATGRPASELAEQFMICRVERGGGAYAGPS